MRNRREADAALGSAVTRRAFIGEIALAGAALSALPMIRDGRATVGRGARVTRAQGGVVAFHMDQPYWDASGVAVPYLPPQGMRSAAPIAHLSEAELRGMQCYV
jgi:hypothetical protein